jgi:general secretion pathway protein K
MNNRRRGSILVIVLFLTGLLGVLATVAATVMRAASDASRAFAENLRAEEAMRGAIEQTVLQAAGGIQQFRGTNVVQVGSARVALTVRNEAARIDLNHAPPELLAGIFRLAGVDAAMAAAYADRIVDWRDEDDDPSPKGAERGTYREAGLVDGPRNGPFLHVAELLLVLGVPARVAAAVSPYVTVASGLEMVNPLIADPPVLYALPGTTEERVRDFLDFRAGATVPFETLILRLGPVQDFVTDENGRAVRMEGRVQLGTGNERRFEAVVAALEGDTEPYRIVAWDANPPVRAGQ